MKRLVSTLITATTVTVTGCAGGVQRSPEFCPDLLYGPHRSLADWRAQLSPNDERMTVLHRKPSLIVLKVYSRPPSIVMLSRVDHTDEWSKTRGGCA